MINFSIGTFIVKNYFIIFAISSIAFSLLVFGYFAFQHTNEGRAIYFEKLSQKFPPNSTNAIRFRSISHALSLGKRNYTFHIKGDHQIFP